MSKSKEAVRIVVGSMMVAATVFNVGGCIYMLRELLSARWIPICLTLVFAGCLALPLRSLWRRLTKSSNIALHLILHICFTWPLVLLLALIINFVNPASEKHRMDMTVERVYTETRYHTKRVGRRTYSRGAPYKVYRIDITTPDGRSRGFDVKKKIYDRVSKGDTIELDVYRGILGMTVFNAGDIHLKPEMTKERKDEKVKETRRERMHRKYREHIDRIRGIRTSEQD